MGFGQKFKEFIAPMDDDEVLELDEEEAVGLSEYESHHAKAMPKMSGDTKMVLFEPRLKENRAAVINLHKLQREYAQRTIDFLTGVVFALDGSIQKIGHNVILCTPKVISVGGKINLDAGEE